jgi:hypothetical protein
MVEKMKKVYFILHFALCVLNYSFAQDYAPNQLLGELGDFNMGLALEVRSSTLSSRPCPKQTDAQRLINDALTPPQEGDCYWSTDKKAQMNYDGGIWKASGGSSITNWTANTDYKAGTTLMFGQDLFYVPADYTSTNDFYADFVARKFRMLSSTDTLGGVVVSPAVQIINPNTVNIGPGAGVIVDPFSQPPLRTFTRVDWIAQDVAIPIVPQDYFYIRVLAGGLAEAVTGKPTVGNYQDDVIVALGFTNPLGEVMAVYQHGWYLGVTDSKIQDLSYYLGLMNSSGDQYAPIDLTMNLLKTSGTLMGIGLNPNDPRGPNIFQSPVENPVTFTYVTSDNIIGTTNLVDPTLYQPNGAGALVAVTNNRWTIQRIYISAYGKSFVQYGQKQYQNYQEALSDVKVSSVTPYPILANPDIFIWTGYIIVLREAVNINDTAQAQIANCGKFGCEGSGSSLAGAVNGDVFGPAASIDNMVPRFHEDTGKIIQESNVFISDVPLLAPFTNELKISEVAVPVIRADGDTDNQQAGTLFLSQGDAYGYKISYDALDTLDGLKIIGRVNNVETTKALFTANTIYLGNQNNNVVDDVGDGGVAIIGAAGALNGGPHLQFNDTGDIYPQRQLLNWGHSNMYDCFDCYHSGADWRHSTAASSFRWQKTATDLILASTAAPTVGGNEAFTNRFWVNENGDSSFSGNIYQQGYLVDGEALQRIMNEEVQAFTPINTQTFCAWGGAGGGQANPLVVPAGINNMQFGDGCWGSPVFLPAVAAAGTVMYYTRFSGFGVNIATDRTDQAAQVGIGGNNRATYISNGATWVYQGQAPANARTLIGSLANPGFGVNGQQLTTNGAGTLTWLIAASDRRLKTNIKNLDNGLDIINALMPVEFNWNEQGIKFTGQNTKKHIGLIAQDVEKILPGAIKGTDIKILNYDEITASLVKAVQEQGKEIELLKEKLNGSQKPSQLPSKKPSKPSPLPAKKPIKISSKLKKSTIMKISLGEKTKKCCTPICETKSDKDLEEIKAIYLREKLDKAEWEIKSLKEINWWIRH